MSKEVVQNFYAFLQQDSAVVEELKKAAEKVDSAEKAVETVIAFAREKGFEFTKEDLAAFEEENKKELSAEELDKINAAGGATVCVIIGLGWGTTEGVGIGLCKVIGIGVGVGWESESVGKGNSFWA